MVEEKLKKIFTLKILLKSTRFFFLFVHFELKTTTKNQDIYSSFSFCCFQLLNILIETYKVE